MAISTVYTNYGTIIGCNQNDFTVFKGIPFAKSPVGNLRFAPPEKPEAFQEPYHADTFRSIPMQHFTDPDGLYKKEFYSNPEFEFPVSEDCLYLNIWTPAENPTDNLPVIVWIHGGGFEHGFSTELEFDGAEYCKRNVILATISYRVNAFGFLYDPEQEREIGHSGNQGLQDQIAALTWIKENIQAFGGNPDNITLMGQSAGAMSTQILCLSPLSSPMLHQAILQSGGGLSPMSGTFFSKEEAWTLTREYYKLCGVTTMKELLPLSAEFLLDKADELMAAHTFLPFRPVVDGYVLPDTPETMGKRKELAKIPYLMGATKDDLGIPENAVSHRESTFFQSAVSYGKMCASYAFPPIYLYEFCRDLPGSNDGAFHSSELWYTFGTLDRCWRPMEEKDYQISRQMLDYWTNFAKAGNPNGDGLPMWNPSFSPEDVYTTTDPTIMTFI